MSQTEDRRFVGRKIVGQEFDESEHGIGRLSLYLDDGTRIVVVGDGSTDNYVQVFREKSPLRILTSLDVPPNVVYNVPTGAASDSLGQWIIATFNVALDRPTVLARDEATARAFIDRYEIE